MLLQVSAGLAHTAIIDATGALYTLGWNQDGQLGVGDLRSRDRPTLVAGLLEQEDAVQVLAIFGLANACQHPAGSGQHA